MEYNLCYFDIYTLYKYVLRKYYNYYYCHCEVEYVI